MSTLLRVAALASATLTPALALDNPMVVDVHAKNAAAKAASATIFQNGGSVLVNVTGTSNIPKNAAVTLNDGGCSNPGGVAFALSPFSDNQSLTTLSSHTLSDIAGKAKSMVVHRNGSQTSPAFACGDLKA